MRDHRWECGNVEDPGGILWEIGEGRGVTPEGWGVGAYVNRLLMYRTRQGRVGRE